MNRVTRSSIAILAAAGAVLPLAACGKEDPKVAAVQAMNKIADAKEQSITFKLDNSPESLVTLARQMDTDDNGNPKKDLTAKEKDRQLKLAQAAANTSITFQGKSHNGKSLGDNGTALKDSDAGVFVRIGKNPVLSLLTMGEKPYMQLDAKAIARTTGLFTEQDVEKVKIEEGDSPWMRALMDNKWVTTDQDIAKRFISGLQESRGSDGEELSKDQVERLRRDTQTNLEKNSSFTWGDGDAVEIRTDVKKVGEQLLVDYKKDAPGKLTEKDEREFREKMGELKTGATFLSTWTVKDGVVKRIKMDVMQIPRLADETKLSEKDRKDVQRFSKYNVNFVADLSDTADGLSTPSGAVKIDGNTSSSLGGSSSSASSSSV